MAIIVTVLALYGFFSVIARIGRTGQKAPRNNEVYEPEEFMPESVPPNVVEMVPKETKAHVSAVIRRAQQTGKWIEALLYLEERYSGASLQYARKRVQGAFRAGKGATNPGKTVVNGDLNRADETDGSDESFE